MNVDVGIQYLEAWLRGNGAVPIYNLMEDAATAEISRAQVWQWAKHGAKLFIRHCGVVALARPGRQSRPVVARSLVVRTVPEILDQGDPRGQLGFLLGVEVAGKRLNTPNDLRAIDVGPARRIDRHGNDTGETGT